MPELPEVETTARGIAPHLVDHRVSHVVVRHHQLREPVPADLADRLAGQRLGAVTRRAKYLLLDFGRGQLLVHLGMSGSLRIVPADTPPAAHDHVDIGFGEHLLRYRDPRRFGLMRWIAEGEPLPALLTRLGIEPLSEAFDGAWLHRATRDAKRAIKTFIMDSHEVVGVGNIYASESLFRAGIHPLTPAGRLGPARCARLAGAIRDTLTDAIAAGGSSLRDFVGSDGRPGYFQQQYFVYARSGEPCRCCGKAIVKAVIGQRASFFCPHCQHR
jgi:formamidopyrimidine-DNA glycosylase